ncbi:sulfatase [Planctomycetota bacterium]
MIISDDHRWCDSKTYGNNDVHMPNLDQLAADGMRFDGYYTPAPICAPARMALYSGVYPVRNGGYPNHSRSHEGMRSMVHHLGGLGYRVGLHGKKHFGPESVYSFEKVDDVKGFIERDSEEPFCLVIATKYPHTPWGECLREHYDQDRIGLAPNLIDTPLSRDGLSRYYSDLTRLDQQIGEYVDYVDNSGNAENTIVIYTSDHGHQFPGAKWTCYEPGLKVPFVIRWPDRIRPGAANTALTQHVDVLPTLIEAAGGEPASIDTGRAGAEDGGTGFDGRSFLAVLSGGKAGHRDYVYGVNTQEGTINGLPYPIRSVCSGSHKYIRNYCNESEYRNVITGTSENRYANNYWQEWLEAAETDDQASFLVERYLHRPPEELYDLEQDPWELDNRIDDENLADIKEELEQQLAKWMDQQGDRGLETEMLASTRQGAA